MENQLPRRWRSKQPNRRVRPPEICNIRKWSQPSGLQGQQEEPRCCSHSKGTSSSPLRWGRKLAVVRDLGKRSCLRCRAKEGKSSEWILMQKWRWPRHRHPRVYMYAHTPPPTLFIHLSFLSFAFQRRNHPWPKHESQVNITSFKASIIIIIPYTSITLHCFIAHSKPSMHFYFSFHNHHMRQFMY